MIWGHSSGTVSTSPLSSLSFPCRVKEWPSIIFSGYVVLGGKLADAGFKSSFSKVRSFVKLSSCRILPFARDLPVIKQSHKNNNNV